MATSPSLPISPPVTTKPTRNKIDVAKALKLRLSGNTLQEIGSIFGCSDSAVHQALAKFEPFLNGIGPGELSAYSENRADLFNRVEQVLTASMLDGEKLQKASLNNLAYSFRQIHDARRLETGQSTNNVSVLGKLILDAEAGLGAEKLASKTASTAASPAQEQPIITEASDNQ